MAHKITPYLLPIATLMVVAVAALFFRPQITGFFIAQPGLSVQIKITADEVLPENAVIKIFLEKDGEIAKEVITASISEFVKSFAQTALAYQSGSNKEIDYNGYGYLGSDIFNLNVDTTGLNRGNYTLKTDIMWQDKVISETQQEIEV